MEGKGDSHAIQHRHPPYQRGQVTGGGNHPPLQREAAPPVVITQNGEAKAVLMGIQEYKRIQETLAMLKALSFSDRSLESDGRPAREVFSGLRKGRKADR